jgi:hypothetical protein
VCVAEQRRATSHAARVTAAGARVECVRECDIDSSSVHTSVDYENGEYRTGVAQADAARQVCVMHSVRCARDLCAMCAGDACEFAVRHRRGARAAACALSTSPRQCLGTGARSRVVALSACLTRARAAERRRLIASRSTTTTRRRRLRCASPLRRPRLSPCHTRERGVAIARCVDRQRQAHQSQTVRACRRRASVKVSCRFLHSAFTASR